DEALAFLLARAEREEAGAEEQNAAAELAEELACLPLALEQAGAYVLEQQLRFASYLMAYREQGLELLDRSRPVVEGHPDPVTTTWAMNMREVGEASPASADLLRACAFLAPDDVPEELVSEGGAKLGPAIAAVLSGGGALAVGELLAPLVRYSLIRRDLEGRAWSVHRLLQEVVKASLGEEDRRRWVEQVIRALNEAFPWPEFSTWPVCGRLLPHVLALVGLPEAKELEIEETGHLLNSAAGYLWNRARYAEAEPLFERAIKIREKALGEEHPLVAKSLNNLALLYRDQGRLAEAESLFERSLKIREKALGDEHPQVAQSLENYALLLRDTERTSEAEEMEARARTIRERHAARERERGSDA
ncbi:MAG: tetratricopeptide repeat protein, partial [bacterium]|nr:tetratricopeptide repeat protein [bacterium]